MFQNGGHFVGVFFSCGRRARPTGHRTTSYKNLVRCVRFLFIWYVGGWVGGEGDPLGTIPEVLLVAEVPGRGLAGDRSVRRALEHGPLPELYGHRLHPQRREELLCQLEDPATYPSHATTFVFFSSQLFLIGF